MPARTAIIVVSHKSACDPLGDITPVEITVARCKRLRKVDDIKIITTERLKPFIPETGCKVGVCEDVADWFLSETKATNLADRMRAALKRDHDILLIAPEYPLLGTWSLNSLLSGEANCYAGARALSWGGEASKTLMAFSGAALVGSNRSKPWTAKPIALHEMLCLRDAPSRRLVLKAHELGYTD